MVDNDSVDNLVNKMFDSEEIDVNKVCRSCLLNTGDTTPMHHEYSRDLCVVDVFLSTTSLKFNADYPRQICSYCLSELNRSFDFISKCRESDRKLREYFDKIRTKENEVSVDIQLGNTANNLNINNSDTQGVTLHDIYMPDVEFALQIEQEIKLEENNTPNIASTNSLEDPLTIDEMQIDLETNVNFDIKTEHEHDYNELLSISPVDQIPVAHIEESHHETPPSYGKRNADRVKTGKINATVDKKGKNKCRNPRIRTKTSYTLENLTKALEEIKDKKISFRTAKKKYGIPVTTLCTKYHEKTPIIGKRGPATVCSYEEENRLVEWIIACGDKGSPVTKKQLLDSAQELLVLSNRKTTFIENRPGSKWFSLFLERHKDRLTKRCTENFSKARAYVTVAQIRHWFQLVESYLTKNNLLDIDASRVFNLDELAFCLNSKLGKVLAKKGTKNVNQLCSGQEKEAITVLYTTNAAGDMPPPFILFKYIRVPKTVVAELPDGYSYSCTESGLMDNDKFFDYIKRIFYPWLKLNNIQFPVVLYVDGNASHLTLALTEFCDKHGIIIIALLPNSTHFLQPCAVSLFEPLNISWKKCVNEWLETKLVFTKKDFGNVIKKATDSLDIKQIMPDGFRRCGLYPFNADAFNYKEINKYCDIQHEKQLPDVHGEIQGHPKIDQIPLNEDVNLPQSNKPVPDILMVIEKCLSVELLNEFQQKEVPQESNKGLYDLWLKLKHEKNSSS